MRNDMKGEEHTKKEEIELRIEQYCADYAERNEPIRIIVKKKWFANYTNGT